MAAAFHVLGGRLPADSLDDVEAALRALGLAVARQPVGLGSAVALVAKREAVNAASR